MSQKCFVHGCGAKIGKVKIGKADYAEYIPEPDGTISINKQVDGYGLDGIEVICENGHSITPCRFMDYTWEELLDHGFADMFNSWVKEADDE